MAGESTARRRLPSRENKGTIVPRNFAEGNLSKFGKHVMLCAGGIKPGDWLAARIRQQGGECTERHANLIITGRRKPNARAAAAVHLALLDD